MQDKEPALRILSLGAGVQSSTMALMADKGEFGVKPDAAVFADTGWEPKPVIQHLEYLKSVISYPIHIVKKVTFCMGVVSSSSGEICLLCLS